MARVSRMVATLAISAALTTGVAEVATAAPVASSTTQSSTIAASSTSRASTTARVSPNATKVVKAVKKKYPKITRVLTTRSGGGDHSTGHAVDIMIPKYKSSGGRAQGDAVAKYLKANAPRLGITYIIWRQRIWSVQRADEGWRPMSNRGSATANHYDHVHVSVK